MVSFVLLCLLLGVGHLLRTKLRILQKLYLPSCVIAGLVGLAVIQIIAAVDPGRGPLNSINSALAQSIVPWSKLPGLLINIVFACLFLGVTLPKFSTLVKRAGPQLAYGQIVAWGQYLVALALFIFLIKSLFPSLPGMFAGILPVGFEGGHGTAAGMAETFAHPRSPLVGCRGDLFQRAAQTDPRPETSRTCGHGTRDDAYPAAPRWARGGSDLVFGPRRNVC